MQFLRVFILPALLAGYALAQTPAPAPTPAPDASSTEPGDPPGGKRVFGVLPNYRTADADAEFAPITPRNKFTIASKDSFDYPLVFLAAGLAGIGQLTNQSPSFGQGMKGFGHRLVTNYADQAIGNLMAEGLYPSLLHEDPRYFRKGPNGGSAKSRTLYALSRIFVTRTDAGNWRFNTSEWLGNATVVAISQTYYPDNRTASDAVTKLLTQCATDAASQVLKEFWPDIHEKLKHHHSQSTALKTP